MLRKKKPTPTPLLQSNNGDNIYYELERKCWRKRGYNTSREAQRQIHKKFRKLHLRLYKYRCASCGKYHLTKSLSAKGNVL